MSTAIKANLLCSRDLYRNVVFNILGATIRLVRLRALLTRSQETL